VPKPITMAPFGAAAGLDASLELMKTALVPISPG
jgi:hypothetical protein